MAKLRLREAWFEIAREIAIKDETWICNAAKRLYQDKQISLKTLKIIHMRIQLERVMQGVVTDSFERGQRYNLSATGPSSSLWTHVQAPSDQGRILRIQFITKELRRLTK